MPDTKIFERVKKICVEHLGVNDERVTLEAKLDTDLGADSLDHVELVMAIEEEFDIEISDEEGSRISTVEDAVKFIAVKLG